MWDRRPAHVVLAGHYSEGMEAPRAVGGRPALGPVGVLAELLGWLGRGRRMRSGWAPSCSSDLDLQVAPCLRPAPSPIFVAHHLPSRVRSCLLGRRATWVQILALDLPRFRPSKSVNCFEPVQPGKGADWSLALREL